MAISMSYSACVAIFTFSLVFALAQQHDESDPCAKFTTCETCLNATLLPNVTCGYIFGLEGSSGPENCTSDFEHASAESMHILYNVTECKVDPTTTTTTTPTTTTTTPLPPTNATTTIPTTTTAQPNTTTTTTSTTTTAAPIPTTTAAPNTTSTTTSTSTTPSPVPLTTSAPSHGGGGMSWASFFGGIVFTAAVSAVAFLVWRFYKARAERNYHTLSTNLI